MSAVAEKKMKTIAKDKPEASDSKDLASIEAEEVPLVEELQTFADEIPQRKAELEKIEGEAAEADAERQSLQQRFSAGEFDVEQRLVEVEALAKSKGRRAVALRGLIEGFPDRSYRRILQIKRKLQNLHRERLTALNVERLPRLEGERERLLGQFFSSDAIDAARRLAGIEDGMKVEGDSDFKRRRKREALEAYLLALDALDVEKEPIVQSTEALPSESPHQRLMDAAMTDSDFTSWEKAQPDPGREQRLREMRIDRAYARDHDHLRSVPCHQDCPGYGQVFHTDYIY